METRDLSEAKGAQAPEEQTLNPEAVQSTAETAEVEQPKTDESESPLFVAEEEMSEAMAEAQAEEDEAVDTITKEAVKNMAMDLLEKDPAEIQRDQVSKLRQRYAAIHKQEEDAARTAWAEAGNDPEAFVAEPDPDEETFNAVIAQIREKKAAWAAEQEKQREQNLKDKNDIIDQINALAEDTDNVNRTFPLYRELQDKFNAIGKVPDTEETAVWKRFQEAREKYTDNLKINKELRDYDFKKNLDSKIMLIEEATALDGEGDVVVAFRRLQDLHDKWRQIGPVAKELREEIWQKFKDASAVVNKKYQAFFEERKAREQQNEAAKTALCEQIEAIDFAALNSFAAWEDTTKKIIDLQAEWKKLGYASRKANNALFARFRQRCDEFFAAKGVYFKGVKEEYASNLAKKTALAERAEALKESTEWRKATDEFVAMQKEWKQIGAVPKKHSDGIWKRFLAACDYFFDKKKAATQGQRSTEQANLAAKKEIIDEIKQLSAETEDAAAKLRALQDRWQQVGHVPFRDKDKINDAYRTALNEKRKALNINENRARMDRFEINLAQIDGDENKLLRERERLARALESRKIEIRTYENNLGFLSSKSKMAESMVSEFRAKIDRIKDDIKQIEDKIKLIDSKLV